MTPLLASLLLLGAAAEASAPASPTADELEIDPLEPDFVVVNLPTTARLPQGKLAFRVTHRFARGLGEGDLSDLASDFFGLDGGAQIGLELRFGLLRATQLGAYRTSDRTLVLFLVQGLLRQGTAPLSVQAVAAIEGRDNLGEEHSPRFGLALSRRLGDRAVLYAAPAFVGNSKLGAGGGDDDSVVLGVGARLRVSDKTSLLAEVHPRLAGYDGGREALVALGIERVVGGHAFQLNVSNDLGTTPAQIARGQQGKDDWFLGFNIARKFY